MGPDLNEINGSQILTPKEELAKPRSRVVVPVDVRVADEAANHRVATVGARPRVFRGGRFFSESGFDR